MNIVERVARAICEADGIDPELICAGMGVRMPEGEKYAAWKYRIKQAEAAIIAMHAYMEE